MQGLKALLRVRQVAEDKALKVLSYAKRDYDKIRLEEDEFFTRSKEAKETLRNLEKKQFGIRESILYRRYLNTLRGRLARCRNRKLKVKKVMDGKIKQYEQTRHDREAIDDLIEKRKEEAKKEEIRKDELQLGELGRQKWFRDRNPVVGSKKINDA